MRRFGMSGAGAVLAAIGVSFLATPAQSVSFSQTQWATSGTAIAKVKGIGRAKSDAALLLTFFAGGPVRAEDGLGRELAGEYRVVGRRQDKAQISLDTASTALLEDVIETEIEAAVLRKAGQVVDVSVDVTTIRAKAHQNKRGTKLRFKLKAKAFGRSDVDARRRKTTYTVRTRGASTL